MKLAIWRKRLYMLNGFHDKAQILSLHLRTGDSIKNKRRSRYCRYWYRQTKAPMGYWNQATSHRHERYAGRNRNSSDLSNFYLPVFAKKVAGNGKMIDFPFSIINFIWILGQNSCYVLNNHYICTVLGEKTAKVSRTGTVLSPCRGGVRLAKVRVTTAHPEAEEAFRALSFNMKSSKFQ